MSLLDAEKWDPQVDNPLTLNYESFLQSFYLCFMQTSVDWILIIFQTLKKKRPAWTVFPGYLSFSYDYVNKFYQKKTELRYY